MRIKITRPDGSVIDVEGTSEECLKALETFKEVPPTVAPTVIPVPYPYPYIYPYHPPSNPWWTLTTNGTGVLQMEFTCTASDTLNLD